MMIKIHKLNYIQKIIVLLCLCFTIESYTKEQDDADHLWEGNLSLSTSQQPGALVALGQNIVDKNDLLIFFDYERAKGSHKKSETVSPIFIYGINEISSLFLTIPISTNQRDNNLRSSGLNDVTVQYEYAYFVKNSLAYGIQGTVLANIGIPTGSFKKNPYTGAGSPSFLLGTTFSYLSVNWYAYGSGGATLTTSHHGNKRGNEYLYQTGFGKNIAYRSKKWILTGIIEVNGTYQERDKFNCIIDENSGGNTLLIGPTLWFSTKKLIIIADISVPIIQHLFGKQNKTDYMFELTVGWKFN